MAWHLIKQGNGFNSEYKEFLIDSTDDISDPPTGLEYAPSSIAHTPGYANIYEADASGTWVEIGGDS